MTKIRNNQKILCIVLCFIALAKIGWTVAVEKQRYQIPQGADIEIDPVPFQRDLRLTIAFIVLSVSLYSFAAACSVIGLVVFLTISIEVFLSTNYGLNLYNMKYHILVISFVTAGVVLCFRKFNHLLISALGCVYILAESLLWILETQQIRVNADVKWLYPPTLLNNIFHRGHWSQVVIILISLSLLLWILVNVAKENKWRTSRV